MTFLNIIFMIISVLIIILSLLQSAKSTDGLSSAIRGGMANNYVEVKERGPEVIISRITMVLCILFFTLSIIIHFLMVR